MGHQHDGKCGQKGSCNPNKGNNQQKQGGYQPQPERRENCTPPSKGPQNKPYKK